MEETMEKYNGYQELVLTNDQFTEIYTDGRLGGYDFKENEYLIAKNENGEIIELSAAGDVLKDYDMLRTGLVYPTYIISKDDLQKISITPVVKNESSYVKMKFVITEPNITIPKEVNELIDISFSNVSSIGKKSFPIFERFNSAIVSPSESLS